MTVGMLKSIRDAIASTGRGKMPPRLQPGPEWLSWGPPVNMIREGYYQDAIRSLLGVDDGRDVLRHVLVELRREPDNTHDENAIRAFIESAHIGYVRREVAAQMAPLIDASGMDCIVMHGVIRGGFIYRDGDIIYGVHVWPDRCTTQPPPGWSVTVDEELIVQWPPHAHELTDAGITQ